MGLGDAIRWFQSTKVHLFLPFPNRREEHKTQRKQAAFQISSFGNLGFCKK